MDALGLMAALGQLSCSQLTAPLLSTQVLVLSPAFLKYIHDNWTQRRGRYPSTGFTALLFAMHACQRVSVDVGPGAVTSPALQLMSVRPRAARAPVQ